MQLIKNTDKSICEGQSWTRCFLNFLVKFRQSGHPHWAWAWIVSARSGSTVVGTALCLWAGLCSLHQECLLSSEQSICLLCAQQACTELSLCIFFIVQIVIHKALSSEDSEDALLERSWDYLVIRRKPHGQCFLWRPWILLYSLLIRDSGRIYLSFTIVCLF